MQRSRGGNTPVPGEMKGDLTIANGIAGVQIWGYSAYHDVGDLKPHEFRYSGSPATFNVTALYVDEMYIGTVLLDWPWLLCWVPQLALQPQNDKTKRLPTFGSLFVLGSGWNKIY